MESSSGRKIRGPRMLQEFSSCLLEPGGVDTCVCKTKIYDIKHTEHIGSAEKNVKNKKKKTPRDKRTSFGKHLSD